MSMLASDPGEKSLAKLLATLTTSLHGTIFVFATLTDPSALPPLEETQLLFKEKEGISVIISKEYATAHKIDFFFPCKMITLNVTSSLEAVGFMAVIATKLAEHNMGVNPVSGFYHDHLFIPLGREEEAVEILRRLAEDYKQKTLTDE
ncbi:integron cassette [Trichoderma arundinaceum]|uniref:Integron cassette n=1 Tax=Trichoderma arundinaceum TaxID=490622 RepID=A0A395NTJ3_TRIAR|nr:integron cassette [Trichoderma arundinaceum]